MKRPFPSQRGSSDVRALWERWKRLARKIADFQARVVLTLFYFAVLGPFAVAVRLGADPLGIKRPGAPAWRRRPERAGVAAEWAARQS